MKRLSEEIQERIRQDDSNRDDILTLLIAAQDEASQPMTDEELCDQLLTLLFAGHETTASALACAFCWSDRLAEVKGKLLQELDTLPADADPIPFWSHRFWSLGLTKCLQVMVFSKHLGCNHKTKLYSTIARLPSLRAVCSETLQIYSIAVTFFARILNTSSYKLFYFISLSIFLSCFKAGVTIATK